MAAGALFSRADGDALHVSNAGGAFVDGVVTRIAALPADGRAASQAVMEFE